MSQPLSPLPNPPTADAEEAAEQEKERAHRAAIERALALLPNSPDEARKLLQEALEGSQSDTGDE